MFLFFFSFFSFLLVCFREISTVEHKGWDGAKSGGFSTGPWLYCFLVFSLSSLLFDPFFVGAVFVTLNIRVLQPFWQGKRLNKTKKRGGGCVVVVVAVMKMNGCMCLLVSKLALLLWRNLLQLKRVYSAEALCAWWLLCLSFYFFLHLILKKYEAYRWMGIYGSVRVVTWFCSNLVVEPPSDNLTHQTSLVLNRLLRYAEFITSTLEKL